MKIIKLFIVLFYAVSIVFIPMSFFELNGRIVFIVIGYGCLVIGGILTIFKICLEAYKNRKGKKK